MGIAGKGRAGAAQTLHRVPELARELRGRRRGGGGGGGGDRRSQAASQSSEGLIRSWPPAEAAARREQPPLGLQRRAHGVQGRVPVGAGVVGCGGSWVRAVVAITRNKECFLLLPPPSAAPRKTPRLPQPPPRLSHSRSFAKLSAALCSSCLCLAPSVSACGVRCGGWPDATAATCHLVSDLQASVAMSLASTQTRSPAPRPRDPLRLE